VLHDDSVALPAVRLREDRYTNYLEIEGIGRISQAEDDDEFIGPLSVVRRMGLSSLRRTLIAYVGATMPPPRTFIHPETGEKILIPREPGAYRARVQAVDVTPKKFAERHTYEFLPEPVSLVLREGGILATEIQFAVETEDEPDEARIRTLVSPLLRRTGATLDGIELEPEGPLSFRTSRVVISPDFWVISVYLATPTHGRTGGFAIDVGNEALAILEAANGSRLTAGAARSLIQSGHADSLRGLEEGAWLECKTEPYAHTELGKFELAKDVTALANAEGGIIVIGLQTRSIKGRDVITAVRPFHSDGREPDRYRKLIDYRVFPQPIGLKIEAVRYGARGSIVAISIPPQPTALQPFLVRGTFSGKKLQGSQIGVFTRRGDATFAMGVEEFHSLVVAGRAALGYRATHAGEGDGGLADHI
jgi:hypothetical protein